MIMSRLILHSFPVVNDKVIRQKNKYLMEKSIILNQCVFISLSLPTKNYLISFTPYYNNNTNPYMYELLLAGH